MPRVEPDGDSAPLCKLRGGKGAKREQRESGKGCKCSIPVTSGTPETRNQAE